MSHKKLLILGGTRGVGEHVVTQALQAGHEVTVFARTADKIPVQDHRLRLVAGTVTDGSRLSQAARGQDVVISALGQGMSLKADGLIQRSVPVILSARRRPNASAASSLPPPSACETVSAMLRCSPE